MQIIWKERMHSQVDMSWTWTHGVDIQGRNFRILNKAMMYRQIFLLYNRLPDAVSFVTYLVTKMSHNVLLRTSAQAYPINMRVWVELEFEFF